MDELIDFLEKDISPSELSRHLENIYHEFTQCALRENGTDEETVAGLDYLHKLKRKLEKC